MVEHITLTGMVVSAMPVGDYDKRLVLVTRERGRITVFARGARRQNSKFTAISQPFTFGDFTLYPGKDAYSLASAEVKEYFDGISTDISSMYYGFYFLEIASHFTIENVEATEVLKLLYFSMKALLNDKIPNRLVRRVFELKILSINGTCPDVFEDKEEYKLLNPSTLYAMQFIVSSKIEKLYTFTVTDEVLKELERMVSVYIHNGVDRPLKSEEMLSQLAFLDIE